MKPTGDPVIKEKEFAQRPTRRKLLRASRAQTAFTLRLREKAHHEKSGDN
jgi:hypothetical protein